MYFIFFHLYMILFLSDTVSLLTWKSVKWQEFIYVVMSPPWKSHINNKSFTKKLSSFLFELTFYQSDIALISLQRIINYQVTRYFKCSISHQMEAT